MFNAMGCRSLVQAVIANIFAQVCGTRAILHCVCSGWSGYTELTPGCWVTPCYQRGVTLAAVLSVFISKHNAESARPCQPVAAASFNQVGVQGDLTVVCWVCLCAGNTARQVISGHELLSSHSFSSTMGDHTGR